MAPHATSLMWETIRLNLPRNHSHVTCSGHIVFSKTIPQKGMWVLYLKVMQIRSVSDCGMWFAVWLVFFTDSHTFKLLRTKYFYNISHISIVSLG